MMKRHLRTRHQRRPTSLGILIDRLPSLDVTTVQNMIRNKNKGTSLTDASDRWKDIGVFNMRTLHDHRFNTAMSKELKSLKHRPHSHGSSSSSSGDGVETLDVMKQLASQFRNLTDRYKEKREKSKCSRTKQREFLLKSNRKITDFIGKKRVSISKSPQKLGNLNQDIGRPDTSRSEDG